MRFPSLVLMICVFAGRSALAADEVVDDTVVASDEELGLTPAETSKTTADAKFSQVCQKNEALADAAKAAEAKLWGKE